MRCLPILLALSLSLSVGCGGEKATFNTVSKNLPAAARGGAEEAAPAGQPPVNPVERKIIYTATVRVIVEDFAKAEQEVAELVKSHQGYLAQSEVTGSPGMPRSGHWKVRVPVAQFDAFREAVAHLGQLERMQTDSDDITDKYYDLEKRIDTKQKLEKRLLDLEKSFAKPEDIFKLEQDLERVRGEVEVMQGQLQRWAKLTALTTVDVTLQERKGYVPIETPTFATSVERRFDSSVEALAGFGKWLALLAVTLAPWLPVVAVVLLPLWLALRRHKRREAVPMATTIVEEPPK